MPIVAAVREAAAANGITLEEAWEGSPPELAEDHPLVAAAVAVTGGPAVTAPYGTDASELQAIAPCIVLGPGDVAEAHRPGEGIAVAELEAAPATLLALGERVAL
jgi:acetylornithine deacetylase/succinyl-diaminopimelate desuccinylase-like protein